MKASASKKSLHASEQDRPDVARRRAQWRKYQGRLDPSRLVFIDETWAKTNMTRTHGRARRGVAIRRRPRALQSSYLAREERRIVFIDFDEFDEVLDSEVGERQHAIVAKPVDPYHAV